MLATDSPCQACGWVFYGFGYAGEACSAECDKILRSRAAAFGVPVSESEGKK